jgi:cell division septal protein FtsQ
MPEKEKKIDEVEKIVKDILDRIIQLEMNNEKILQLQRERDHWKKKYEELKVLYDKCWI